MKIPKTYCELEKFKYNRTKKNFRHKTHTYYIKECRYCNKEFFGSKGSEFCDNSCSSSKEFNAMYGKKLSKEAREKISEKWKDKNSKYNSKEYRLFLKGSNKGKNNPNWKGGVTKESYVLFDTYAPQIDWHEKVRRNKEDPNILEVKCYHCGEWFKPDRTSIGNRLQYLKGNSKYLGEAHLYCSVNCKNFCDNYWISAKNLEKRDRIKCGKYEVRDFELYKNIVNKRTRKNYSLYENTINKDNNERGRNKYHLDHIYSVFDGFNNNILPNIISSHINLQFLKESDNIRKSSRSDITKNELYKRYDNLLL